MICAAQCERNKKREKNGFVRHECIFLFFYFYFFTENRFHKSVLGKLSPADGQRKYKDSGGGIVMSIETEKLNETK